MSRREIVLRVSACKRDLSSSLTREEMVLRVLLKTVIVHKASSVMMLLLQASHTGVIVFQIRSNSENE